MISRFVRFSVVWRVWAVTGLLLASDATASATCLAVSVPEALEASAAGILDVPIVVSSGLDGAEVIGYLITLQFDPTHLQFQGIRTCVGGVDYPPAEWQPLTYNVLGNQLYVSGSGSLPLVGEGCVFVVRFQIASDSLPSTCSNIHLVTALFNAGTPCAVLIDGTACTSCR